VDRAEGRSVHLHEVLEKALEQVNTQRTTNLALRFFNKVQLVRQTRRADNAERKSEELRKAMEKALEKQNDMWIHLTGYKYTVSSTEQGTKIKAFVACVGAFRAMWHG